MSAPTRPTPRTEVSPRALALLDQVSAAVTDWRAAHARVLDVVHTLETERVATEAGYLSLSRLLADHARLDRGEITALRRHARLTHPTMSPTAGPVAPALPATAALLATGTLGDGHVRVIADTMRRLDRLPDLPPPVRAVTEQQLAGLARERTPRALADAAGEIADLLDPDGAVPHEGAEPADELHLLLGRDGILRGKFRYTDPVAAEAILTAIRAATPPPSADGDPTAGQPTTPDQLIGRGDAPLGSRTLEQRRAHAMRDLLTDALTRGLLDLRDEHAGPDESDDPAEPDDDEPDDDGDAAGSPSGRAAPPNEPPRRSKRRRCRPTRAGTDGGERVHVAVTIDWNLLSNHLDQAAGPPGPPDKSPPGAPRPDTDATWTTAWSGRRRLPGLGHLGTGTTISPDTARQLACDAEILPTLLGVHGEPLDIGRKTRTVPLPMRRALTVRDRHCAVPGCRRHPRRCDAHHVRHWALGGPTEINNLALLCSVHHTLVHRSGWQIHMVDGQPWFTPPRWLDPARRPRHNRPWRHDPPPTSLA